MGERMDFRCTPQNRIKRYGSAQRPCASPGQSQFRPVFRPRCQVSEYDRRVLEIGRFLDGHERASDTSLWNIIRRCLESTGRLSNADQLRIKSDRADAALPNKISTRAGGLGISDFTGRPSHFVRSISRMGEALRKWTNLAWQNKISRCASELRCRELRTSE